MSSNGSAHLSDKYAWREFIHRGLPKRSTQERVTDFLEIYGLYDEKTAREQASRCIQCPNPACVNGCPMCNPIPQWMQLTAEGRFLEAAAVLGSVSCMAEICSRMCPQEKLCEDACLLNGVSEPVAIAGIEQFLSEYALAHGHADASTAPPNGLRVAIVGSGPAGLACGDELAKRGYAVTIFDESLVPGGLLVNGTPAFKLERSLVERRIQILKKRGVTFRLGVSPGQDMSLSELRSQFDAVFLGFESRQARPLEIPGANFRGIVQAMPFLLQANSGVALEMPKLDLRGKTVTVIGGGDTAIDCVRTAIRCGAAKVICAYRRDSSSMPCTPHEYQNALEEGGQFLFQVAPVEALGDAEGSLRAVRLVRTELSTADEQNRPIFFPRPGTEFEVATEWLIPALGFDFLACPRSGELGELATNEWGGLVVNNRQMTNIAGVFAGGDIVRGPSLVLHTVRDARRAAWGIHDFLSSRLPGRR